MSALNIRDLLSFLVAAKSATYASENASSSAVPLLPGSKQLEFSEGDFLYRDIYVGMVCFTGQEIVYASGHPVWSMSYSGGLLPNIPQSSAIEVYSFLRKALRSIPEGFPIRGPELLEEKALCYSCKHSGSIELFHGSEVITESSVPVYELFFSGGKLL